MGCSRCQALTDVFFMVVPVFFLIVPPLPLLLLLLFHITSHFHDYVHLFRCSLYITFHCTFRHQTPSIYIETFLFSYIFAKLCFMR